MMLSVLSPRRKHRVTQGSMAKPDTDNGWLKYAHELDAALSIADFTKGARVVLREVFAQIFGPAKLKSATLSPTDIAIRSGSSRPHVARSIRDLLDSHVLSRNADGSYRFLKDYETWTFNGRPRLNQFEVIYCRKAASHAFGFAPLAPSKSRPEPKNASNSDRNDSGNISTEARNDSGNASNSLRNNSGTVLLPELGRFGDPLKNPLLGKRLKDSLSEGASDPDSEIEDGEPFHAEPEPKPPVEPKPLGGNSIEDCQRVFAALEAAYPLAGMSGLCQQWLTERTARVVLLAIDKAVRKPARRPTHFIQSLIDDPSFGVPTQATTPGSPQSQPASPRLPSLAEANPEAFAEFKRRQDANAKGRQV